MSQIPKPSLLSVSTRRLKATTSMQQNTSKDSATGQVPVTKIRCWLCGEPRPLNMTLWKQDFRAKVEDVTGEPIPIVTTAGLNVCDPCQSTVEDFFRYKAHCRNVLQGRTEKFNVEELLEGCDVEITLSEDIMENVGQMESEKLMVEKKKRQYQSRKKTEEEKAMSSAEYQKQYRIRSKIECEMCHQKLDKIYLDGHMNRHYGLEPYACTQCELKFHCKMNLSRHEVRNHAPEEEATPCDVCGRIIPSRLALKQHMKSHREKKFECKQCGVKAPNQHTLKRHVEHIHNQVRNFVCPHCGKAFYRQYVLNIHLRTHSGETPYFCHVCQRGFVHRRIYVDHMKKQHPAEPMMRLDIAKGWKESARNAMGM